MKKIGWIFLILLLLTGCAGQQTFETLGTVPHQSPSTPQQAQVMVQLPEDAAQDVFQGEAETVYVCDGYTICLQTFPSGDLKTTIQNLCGYDPEKLTVMESTSGAADRYDWVWTALADEGDMIGRGAVLDDGNFHYCLYVMAKAADAGNLSEQLNGLFRSFHLETA